jgi:hypothetical protein
MAFRVCCSCKMPAYPITIRRYLEFDQILTGGERRGDETEWRTSGNPWTYDIDMSAPDPEEIVYAVPFRVKLSSTASQHRDNMYLGTTLSSSDPQRTFPIPNRVGLIPSGGHCGPVKIATMTYRALGTCELVSTESALIKDLYYARMCAVRVWVDGVDVTGIVETDVKFSTVDSNVTIIAGGFCSDNATDLTISPNITPDVDSDIWIDQWIKITKPAVIHSVSNGFYMAPRGTILIPDPDTTPYTLRTFSDLRIQSTNANFRVPRNTPWTLEFPGGHAWTPGNWGPVDLSDGTTTQSTTEYLRPTTISGATEWTVATAVNIDDVVVQPATPDGMEVNCVVSLSGAPETRVQRWNLSALSSTGTVTLTKVWIYGRCDSNSDANISLVRLRSGTTWYSADTGITLTPSNAWHVAEFTGGLSGVGSSPAVELTANIITNDGEVYVDAVYVEVATSSSWTRVADDISVFMTHTNGDEIKLFWDEEHAEIHLKYGTAWQLYKPNDTGHYNSNGSLATWGPVGLWDPRTDTIFNRVGKYDRSLTGLRYWVGDSSGTFPDTITLTKN